MPNQERETVRLVLEALLRKLDAEPRNADETGSSVLLSESGSSTPVIVVLGGLSSGPSYSAQRQAGVDEIEAGPAKLAGTHRESTAPHPGLERFPLAEIGSSVPAPKACFMEPDRPCISSGACEMRGY